MLIRLIIIAIMIYLLYRIIKFISQPKSISRKNYEFKAPPISGEDLVEDPACHTYIPVSQALLKNIAGKNYYFCSKECSDRYIGEKSKERQN